MAFIPKGSQIFDQLPSQFESFFPSEQSFADGKLASVLARAGGKNVDLLTRVQAETITQGLQLVQQQKAILVGDFLTARMPQLVGFATDQWGQKVPQGLFASVPFPTSAIANPRGSSCLIARPAVPSKSDNACCRSPRNMSSWAIRLRTLIDP